ncbi:hypothetical protein AQUCO_05400151v1 [Aquilegia coerulea]|uniref:Aquaporin n=1 Tax=Aquilegia coerulea TaxID=218851 RepID=A0A2G5CHU0_AQUCA|nr:hypothetical protein AQUCO_05400151v1 [Aquilegia coerulea]
MCGLLTSLVLGKTLNCVNNKQLSHNLNFFGQQYYFIIILEGKSVFYIYTSLALLGICKLSLRPRRQVTVWTSLVRSLFLQAHYRMITKQLCENPSAASNFSNEASSSGEFKDDQQIGVYSNSIDGNASQETRCCFTSRKNLINTIRMVIAEMLGTFILMFCVCGIIASTQLMKGEVGLLEYAATGGLTIIVVIFSIGPISGAHVNPSVTIAFATLGQIPWSKVPFYILGQLIGSVFATYVGASVYDFKAELVTTRPLHGLKTAFWAEFIATFIIMFLAASMSFEAHAVIF